MKHFKYIHIFSFVLILFIGMSTHGAVRITNKSGYPVIIVPDIDPEKATLQELKHGAYTESTCPVTLLLSNAGHEYYGSGKITCDGSYVILLQNKRLHIEQG